MKRIAIILAALALLVAGWWGYSTYQAQRAAQLAAEQVESDDLENVIWASGTLEPVNWAGLSPALSGTIQRIHTSEGAWVERGQLLLELDNAILQSQVAQAEAAVAEAQAALDKLEAGATAAQLAATAAELAVAQANVTVAAGQMLEVQAAIDVANAHVNAAQQQYNDLASHPTEAERTAAVANMAVAEAGLEHAQAAYNLVRWDPEIGAGDVLCCFRHRNQVAGRKRNDAVATYNHRLRPQYLITHHRHDIDIDKCVNSCFRVRVNLLT